MKTYVIRREQGWDSPEELETAGERSKQVAASNSSEDVSWVRSYVIAESDGTLGTVCIYQASGIDALRDHARQAEMPAGEILEVVDTIVIRPDPAAEVVPA